LQPGSPLAASYTSLVRRTAVAFHWRIPGAQVKGRPCSGLPLG
jgi:hypothetical protein